MLVKVKNWYRELPDNKKWVDMITAVLTIPVLVTVIVSNIGNLKKENDREELTQKPQPTIERVIISEKQPDPSPTPSCISELPNYEISYPASGDKITDDPVCISLNRQDEGNFCPVVWAYRINNSSWSTYTTDPICLYNMATGPVKLEVRTKSTATGLEKTYSRNFNYGTNLPVSPTPTISSVSPTITP